MPRPRPPAEQLRVQLEEFRDRGVSFDRAWALGFERIRYSSGDQRLEWREALLGTREEWQRAYLRQACRSGAAVRSLATV